jgi:hypothetical protein
MRLTIILGCFELEHQITRTLTSINVAICHQQELDVDVVIADNSRIKFCTTIDKLLPNCRSANVCTFGQDPIHFALNKIVAESESDFVCVMIDGARIWSPQILKRCINLLATKNLIHVPNYQIGHSHQMYASERGFTMEDEEKILLDAGWPYLDTEKLIQNSTIEDHAGIGPRIFESNCLFLSRELWTEVRGFDQSFKRADGGFASADLLQRLVSAGGQLRILTSEGTFHQLHAGSTTSGPLSTRQAIKEMTIEYKNIRGHAPIRVSCS